MPPGSGSPPRQRPAATIDVVSTSRYLRQRAARAIAEAAFLCLQAQHHLQRSGMARQAVAWSSRMVGVSGPTDLVVARRLVGEFALAAGLVPQRVAGLVLALSEVATNGLVHGGGAATVLMSRQPEAVMVEAGVCG